MFEGLLPTSSRRWRAATSEKTGDAHGAICACNHLYRMKHPSKVYIPHLADDVLARWALYRSFIQQVVVRPASVEMIVKREALRDGLTKEQSVANNAASADTFTLMIPIRLYRTGHDLRLVINSGATENESGKRDGALIRLVARGRRWYEQLTSGNMPSLRAIANAEGLAERYIARVLAGSLLAPDLIEKVVHGRQPIHFTVESLRRSPPLDWDEQRRRFGVMAR